MHSLLNLIRLVLFKIAPIKKNRLVFTSFSGHYSDNPKYISEMIHRLDDRYELIWLVNPKYFDLVPSYAKVCEYGSLRAYWYMGTAQALVDNGYGNRDYTVFSGSSRIKGKIICTLLNKKNQVSFATMHGTPLKRLGRDQIGNAVEDFICTNTTMLLGNQYSIDIFNHITFDKMNMELIGTPRNDILFSNKNTDELKEKLGLPKGKKVLLFAPTFRNDGPDVEGKNIARSGLNQLKDIDCKELVDVLSEKFGGEWVIVLRFHYHVSELVDWNSLKKEYGEIVINGNSCDEMSEYLACTDLLLTDASSSMFDFSLTKRPCFLYFPDYLNYKDSERGFYVDVNELPFQLSINFDQLCKCIRDFNQNEYELGLDELFANFGYVDDEFSSERIAKYIISEIT